MLSYYQAKTSYLFLKSSAYKQDVFTLKINIYMGNVRNFEKNTCCVVVVLFRVFRTLIPSFVKMFFLKLCAPKLGIYNTYMYLQINEFLLQLQCQILKWITVGFYDRNCAQLKFLPLLYVSSAAHYELSQGVLNSAKSWNFRKVAIFY